MVTASDPTKRRLWLVCFGDGGGGSWWARFLKPGFRHVSALSWFDGEQRWVYVNPSRQGLDIELHGETEVGGRLGQLARDSTLILRYPSRTDRSVMPGMTWYCVGVIKALLGLRSRALSPYSLAKHLLATGAEVVEIPDAGQDSPARSEGGRPAAAGAGAVGG